MDFLFPPICPLCRELLTEEAGAFCPDCEKKLPHLPERLCPGCGGPNDSPLRYCEDCRQAMSPRPWSRAVTAFPYYGLVRQAIHQYKYRGRPVMAGILGKKMAYAWQKAATRLPGEPVDAVTYIPLHWFRYLRRGYNQAALLAQQIADVLQVPCIGTLRRQYWTSQQAKLGAAARMQNLSRAFRSRRPHRWQGKHLLLVDDVFTTGATLNAAARVLLDNGAESVSVLTCARD